MSKHTLYIIAGLVVLAVLGGSMSSPLDIVIQKIAEAIALAEGFFVTGSRPQRNHNPGDLERDITGKGVGWDGPYVIYRNDADGWEALKHQVGLMFGGSAIYNPGMTIREVASHYTTTEQDAWANTVASQLGVTINTLLSQIT